jgi:hypothetical protein
MTKHSKNLSKTLLENSQITGVNLNSMSIELSSNGHGLFIESIEADRYIDLRMCSEKPFWGHGHPLTVQKQYGNIPKNPSPRFPHSLNSKYISELIHQSKLGSSVTLVDEGFLFLEAKKQSEIREIISASAKNNSKFILIEKDLTLGQGQKLSNFPQVDCKKVLLNSHLPMAISINGDYEHKNLTSNQDNNFHNAACNFIEYILLGNDGKFASDRKIIDGFLQSIDSTYDEKVMVRRIGHYLHIVGFNKSISEFLCQGILVSDFNYIKPGEVMLCIPPACTKNELLDTMMRIKNLIME